MSGDHHINPHHHHHQSSPDGSEWQFSSSNPNPSIPMYHQIGSSSSPPSCPPDTLYPDPNPWNHHLRNSQNSGFPENNSNNNNISTAVGKPIPLSPKLDMGMYLPTNPGILPPTLADFPADSSFIERAAKFSSFSAGSFSAMLSPFPQSSEHHLNPYSAAPNSGSGAHGHTPKGEDSSMSPNTMMNNNNEIRRGQTPEGANVSTDSSSKGANSKKRKTMTPQDMELDQVQEGQQFSAEMARENVEPKQNVEQGSSSLVTGKSTGKNAKGNADVAAKQDYIHVRARRGQATNSHSLAERVRRERISERMKYLQDLVPGCSKVTGKAVMLDEIINYVQSLQRQVEFLSMKLAAVNPSIDLNIEGLLSKEMLQARIGPPPLGFSPDLIPHQLLSSHHGLVQAGIPNMVNQTDAFRRAVNAQFAAITGFKEPTPQIANPWDAELQNMVHMNFGTNPPPEETQELNGKPHDGFPL